MKTDKPFSYENHPEFGNHVLVSGSVIEHTNMTVLSALGAGSFGICYKCEEVDTKKLVVVKMLRRGKSQDPEVQKRFLQEWHATRPLRKNQNLVTAYKMGEHDGMSYMVMPFVPGETILKWHPSNNKEAVTLFYELTKAVCELHSHNLVHRDLKPENVMIENGTNRVYVIDFGLTRTVETEDHDSSHADILRTQTGILVGTPAYMSPRQIVGGKCAKEFDIYALGVIFFEVLEGELLIKGTDPLSLMAKITKGDHFKNLMLSTNEDVQRLRDIIKKCLHTGDMVPSHDANKEDWEKFNANARYASAQELRTDLEAFMVRHFPGATPGDVTNQYDLKAMGLDEDDEGNPHTATTRPPGTGVPTLSHPPKFGATATHTSYDATMEKKLGGTRRLKQVILGCALVILLCGILVSVLAYMADTTTPDAAKIHVVNTQSDAGVSVENTAPGTDASDSEDLLAEDADTENGAVDTTEEDVEEVLETDAPEAKAEDAAADEPDTAPQKPNVIKSRRTKSPKDKGGEKNTTTPSDKKPKSFLGNPSGETDKKPKSFLKNDGKR